MKVCFKCGVEKPLDEFYRHPMMGDGHLGKCKQCSKKDVRENRVKNRERYLAYDRERSKDPERQAAIHASSNKDPLKCWARQATKSALKWGIIERQPCEVCGDLQSDAHHENYFNPLMVRWLCRMHHMRTHHNSESAA